MRQERNVEGVPGAEAPVPEVRDPGVRIGPWSARSLIASLLLGRDPPAARPGDLVRWCGLFGVRGATVRVALHRMERRGELHRDRYGYRLAGRLEARRAAQEASLSPRLRRWDGAWRIGVLGGRNREAPVRAEIRRRLRSAGYAALRDGVWVRPDNLAADPPVVTGVACTWWRARPDEDPVALAERLFAVRRWSEEAVALTTRLARITDELGSAPGADLPAAFVTGAAAMAHLHRDPLLPAGLVDDPTAGPDLRDAYRRWQRRFDRAAAAFFRGR